MSTRIPSVSGFFAAVLVTAALLVGCSDAGEQATTTAPEALAVDELPAAEAPTAAGQLPATESPTDTNAKELAVA